MEKKEIIRGTIRANYGRIARREEKSCCGDGCCCGASGAGAEDTAKNIGYSENDLKSVPAGANMGLGCGNPLAIASLQEGETVLDLGCGGGFDCFLSRLKVGESGFVIGVDMTPDMIALARDNAVKSGYKNVEFRLGEAEHLPVADGTVDAILSNCVINLAQDKRQVFREAYRVLRPGGRLSVSDVVAEKPLPEAVKADPSLVSGCIGGAVLAADIRAMLLEAGFEDASLTPKANGREIIQSWGFGGNLEDYVASYEIRARKPK